MNNTTAKVLTALLVLGPTPFAVAQLEVGGDLLDNCGQIDALRSSGDLTAAREKARLCLQGRDQALSGEVSQYFLPQIGSWTRTSLEQNQVMGFNNISAVYEKDGVNVDVSLTGEAGGGGGALGLGGLLGGIAQSALRQSGRQVTVAGLPSSVQPDGTVMVPLEDGSFLTFMSSDLPSADTALAGMGDLINEFPVADINAALQ